MSRLGHDRERRVRRILEDDGWWVARAAGSLGDADLVALKADETSRLVEVKATARSPYQTFGPTKRERLREAAALAGATPLLAWWPSRRPLLWIPATDWPEDGP
jgi:Holliday junction resolvase